MKVSIITINFNNKEGLKLTIESVVKQKFDDFEFIIIDGGSKDGGCEIIKKYESNIDYWVSEPDSGIYNAMNKGIAVARGEYCIFMNSGDCFYDENVLSDVFAKSKNSDIISGNTYCNYWVKPPKSITLDFFFRDTLCHQCTFIRTSLLTKYKYDEGLKIVSDRKFFVQALIYENCSYEAVDVNVVIYDLNGLSANNRVFSELEYKGVLESLIPERIRLDYGTKYQGKLYGDTYYDKLFVELRNRNYKKIIYFFTVVFVGFISVFKKSSRFIYHFPLFLKK